MAVEILMLLPGVILLLLANYTEKRKDLRVLTQVFLALSLAMLACMGLLVVASGSSAELSAFGGTTGYGYGIVMTAVVPFLLFLKPIRAGIAGLKPLGIDIDPDNWLHATALVFAILFAGLSATTALSVDLGKLLDSPIGMDGIILQGIMFAALALIGVGWLSRKGMKEALNRLDIRKPSKKELGLSLAFTGIILGLVIAVGLAVSAFYPEYLNSGSDATVKMLGEITIAVAVIVSLCAGIGEELLFRGAMQPRFGILLTSVIFTVAHIQYPNPIQLGSLFAMSLIFGYERQKAGTVACIITHTLYDFFVLLAAIHA